MERSSPFSLVADIGGTRARFALADAGGRIDAYRELAVAEYDGPAEAISAYRRDVGANFRAAALAIAAPVGAGEVRLTNAGWTFPRAELCGRLGLDRLLLLNDFTALALALPHLPPHELHQVGGGAPEAGGPKALLGPGTGLGVSGLLYDRGRWLPLAGEGGHVTLAPADAREAALLALAWRDHPHVSAERLLCGGSLPLLHRLLCELEGYPHAELGAAEIVAHAVAGSEASCMATIDVFCGMLGTLAGNLALTLGASGGVYVGGGIVPRLGRVFDRSPFRARFEAKGRFSAYLAVMPAYVILSSGPALIGAAQALAMADNDDPEP